MPPDQIFVRQEEFLARRARDRGEPYLSAHVLLRLLTLRVSMEHPQGECKTGSG
jgi:hypothetical protein